jgi:hypothetical protein
MGAAAGLGAVGAATSVAKKLGGDFARTEYLPFLEVIEIYP